MYLFKVVLDADYEREQVELKSKGQVPRGS